MRFALWSIVLAAVAVGIAIFARHSTGFVVIVSAPWRIELSLNLLVFLVIAGYFAFYFLARLAATLIAIPARVRAYRAERVRSRLRQSLNDALLAPSRAATLPRKRAPRRRLRATRPRAWPPSSRRARTSSGVSASASSSSTTPGSAPEVDTAPHHARRPARLPGPLRQALAVLKDLSARDARCPAAPEAAGRAGARTWDEVLTRSPHSPSWAASALPKRRPGRRTGNLNRKAQDAEAPPRSSTKLPAGRSTRWTSRQNPSSQST
jgi:HemY protein